MSTVLITGGSRGIGRHLADGFAAAGWNVILTATDEARAAAAAQQIAQARGVRVIGVELQAADPASVEALAQRTADIEQQLGEPVTTVINNAGVVESPEGPVWDVPAEQLVRTLDTNIRGPFLMVRAFAKRLLETAETTGEPCRIIDLNSGSGAQGTPAYAAYSASKAALFRLADSVHVYGYDRGLRIFEMAPGVIESDMTGSMAMHDWRGSSDWTDPEDVVALALALASGDLDAYSGRFVRAGLDTPESLAKTAAAGLAEDFRRLAVRMD